jgi:hypothetical protein
MDGQALCYPAFPLVVLLHKSYKDGVNWQPRLFGESSKPSLSVARQARYPIGGTTAGEFGHFGVS